MHLLHQRVFAQNGLLSAKLCPNLPSQLCVFALEQYLLLHLAYNVPQAVERVLILHQIVVGSLAQHGYRRIYVFLPPDNQHFDARQPVPNLAQYLLAFGIGE